MSDIEFYKKALERIAGAFGINSPLELIAMAEEGDDYVDCLIKAIKNRNTRAPSPAEAEMREALEECRTLCGKICNSSPDTTIKGEIESLAFMLGHRECVLNAQAKYPKGGE